MERGEAVEEVRKRAGECAGRRGDGRVSGDTVSPL